MTDDIPFTPRPILRNRENKCMADGDEPLPRRDFTTWKDDVYIPDRRRLEADIARHDETLNKLGDIVSRAVVGAEKLDGFTKSLWTRLGIVAVCLAPPVTIVAVIVDNLWKR